LRFGFIEAYRDRYSIVALCRNLEVSKAGYYAWRERMLSARRKADARLELEICSIHRKSNGRYGAPRIHAELRSRGFHVARKRVARLMKTANIKGKKRCTSRATTTHSSHTYPVASNVLKRQFTRSTPNMAWAADITAIPTQEGWLYLAVVIDLFSRKIVGWSMSKFIDADLVLAALGMAIERRQPGPGLIVHTDRGSQYACRDYRTFVEQHGIIPSMSRKRDCWDNAVAESFFSTLKVELKPERVWATRSQARTEIFEYIEAWYNRERRHSSIGYLSPSQFEERQRVA
jgi:putative transposase